ncbi:MAG TPA: DUF1800 family protein [Pyrinomonadaceae bacterium]|jgi:uncharacterized protein (DUF1800 family)
MLSRRLRFWLQILSAGFIVFLLVFPALAEEDTDPNSPTPVLLSEQNSARALATDASKSWRGNLPKPQTRAFGLYQKVMLFVTNVDLMDDEGANAFRVYVEDAKGRQYRFPVVEIQRVKSESTVYALTIVLKDELGFWEQPAEDGDVLIGVAWRGLASNRLRLGLGKTGGEIKDDAPVPAAKTTAKLFSKGDQSVPNSADYVGYRWSSDRIRFLEQATFGPTQALDDRIRRIGLRTWLAEQFEIPYPSAANPYPNLILKPIDVESAQGCPVSDPNFAVCRRDYYTQYPVQTWFYKEAFYGEPQLRHRVAWALGQMWVISGVDTQQSSHMIAYHQMLSKNAFGNWRTLMNDMTLNPGMGNYLDMVRSTKNSPNENYAREVLQLFNVGLFMLNQDGTLQLDGQGNPIPTYDQNTVNNFTKVFTGWTFCEVTATCPNRTAGAPNYKDPMILNTTNHDLTAKTLLNYPGSTTTNVAACAGCNAAAIATYADNSLKQALDNIYNHPNLAPFVSRYLIQQLVTSDPTPAYIGRVAAVFDANRTNPAQLKEVVKAILLDPEARGDIKTDPNYGKLREPVQFMTNLYRQFDVRSFDATTQSDGDVDRFPTSMGQRSFYPPTVFNYYPPDYVVPGTSVLGPEFGIYTTGTSIARANTVNSIVFSRIAVAAPNTPNGTSINLDPWTALATGDTTGNQLMDALNKKMMHGAMSASMRTTILNAVLAVPTTNPLLRAQTAIYLIATSSQYQVQR